jgi:ferredoxin
MPEVQQHLDVRIDRETCMGSGNCQFWAAKVFELGEDGIAYVSDPEGDPEDRVVLAAQGCPTQAISVYRDGQRIA